MVRKLFIKEADRRINGKDLNDDFLKEIMDFLKDRIEEDFEKDLESDLELNIDGYEKSYKSKQEPESLKKARDEYLVQMGAYLIDGFKDAE